MHGSASRIIVTAIITRGITYIDHLCRSKILPGTIREGGFCTTLGIGGSTVITDQFTGRLLFYSDGELLFDAENNQLSSTLDGDASINVPVATAPVSGSPGEYYIFTNSGNGGVNEIVNM